LHLQVLLEVLGQLLLQAPMVPLLQKFMIQQSRTVNAGQLWLIA